MPTFQPLHNRTDPTRAVHSIRVLLVLFAVSPAPLALSLPAAVAAPPESVVVGKAAIPNIAAAIERDLWSSEVGDGRYVRQAELIERLGLLEDRRTDGRITEFIEHMLEQAEAGRPFPGAANASDVKNLDRTTYDRLDKSHNHSLSWLLLTLAPDDAATRYGKRLAQLRNVAAYGWREEVQWLLDHLKLLDRLELKEVESRLPNSALASWEVGFAGASLNDYRSGISRDGRFLASINSSQGRLWRLADQTLVAVVRFEFGGAIGEVSFSPDGRTIRANHQYLNAWLDWDLESGAVRLGPTSDKVGAHDMKARQPAKALRMRDAVGEHRVLKELCLPFQPKWLLVSGDEQKTIIVGEEQFAVVSVESGLVSAARPLPTMTPEFDFYDNRSYAVSHDGSRLVVSKPFWPPRVIDVATGKPISMHVGHHSPLIEVEFIDNDVIRTYDASGVVCRWSISAAARVPETEADRRWRPRTLSLGERAGSSNFLDENGWMWVFIGRDDGKYRLFPPFDVYLIAPKHLPSNLASRDGWEKLARKKGQLRGRIEPQWGQHFWLGLAPGGEYVHVDTRIFSRRDLKPISEANITGAIERLEFRRDGSRYILGTSEQEEMPREIRGHLTPVSFRRRVRVHDTLSGTTLFSKQTPAQVCWFAISPDLTRVAFVDVEHRIEIWPIPAK